MSYWLIKSEPTCYSIDDLKREKKASWTGVRNYQARNYMVRDMAVGDLVLFYHSSVGEIGVAGIARVASGAHVDMTAQDKRDEHYDPKATVENPIWQCVDFAFVKKFKKVVTLSLIKTNPKLKGIMVAQTGSRLSIQPVSEMHFKEIVKMGE
jgi:predicted RNA-binding protein with PUA-like domain